MSSQAALETATTSRARPAHVGQLLVLWQHPENRQIVPIGRMAFDGSTYTFTYVRAAQQIRNFRLLPGFPHLATCYESEAMPPVFAQRVMSAQRPDFNSFLGWLDLTPATVTPWEQIVRSGGARTGDTLQFMVMPEVTDGRARARFLVSGIRHIPHNDLTVLGRPFKVSPEAHEHALDGLRVGSVLDAWPEDHNPVDPSATLVVSQQTPVGYVPWPLSHSARELLDANGTLSFDVLRANGPTTPSHLRLVADLDALAPHGFSFDPDGLWEPVAGR